MDKKQNSLFEELKEDWQEHWEGMPEFVQQEQDCYAKIIIRFRNEDDLQDFATGCLKARFRFQAGAGYRVLLASGNSATGRLRQSW